MNNRNEETPELENWKARINEPTDAELRKALISHLLVLGLMMIYCICGILGFVSLWQVSIRRKQ